MDVMAETYTDSLEANRYILVKSVDPEPFLDYLRSRHVMSDVDCETVQNRYVNQTRRARMGCFVDILRTKGPDGVYVFWTQLGWEYPHVYREIFCKEPEIPPSSYRQDAKSRISCDLNNLLKVGLNISKLRTQQECLAGQLTDMEAMLKHQRCEIEDLERENQRLRHYERDNQQLQERLRTLTTTNEDIKEENRQFLHEIRTLTLDLQKHRNNEAELQGQLDEVTQQIQEKSLELNRTKEEESDLRAKFERVRQQSLKFQTITPKRQPRPPIPETTRMQQDELKRQLDSLAEENQTLENNNKGLGEQLKYMQNLLDDEKMERDQMHRRVCVLEHEKGSLETRLNTSVQKIGRYYKKIKELEEEKMKLEEERMHMQQKIWETSQANERQFDDLHKLEARLDQMQQDYQKFRQEHRYCTPEEPWTTVRDRKANLKAREDPNLIVRSLSPHSSPSPGNDDPFKFFTPYVAGTARHELVSTGISSPAGSDGDIPARGSLQPVRTDSTKVNVGSVMRRNPIHDLHDDVPSDNEDDDRCSTVSSCSSLSSSIFEQVELAQQDHTEPKVVASASKDHVANFFIRSNVREAGNPANQMLAICEGEILFVQEMGDDHWFAVQVDRTTGQLRHEQSGFIPSMDRAHLDNAFGYMRRSPSCEDRRTLQRQGAMRGKGLHHQTSLVAPYTKVIPMKANRPLPVVLVGLSPAMISCMEGTTLDWAHILTDSRVESAAHIFSAPDDKHNVIVWEARPKDHNSDVYKYIVIVINLQSEESVATLRRILNNSDLHVEFKQEVEKVRELEDFVHKAGLHSESLSIQPDAWSSESFWKAVREKVGKVQGQVFWLETSPKNPPHKV